MRLRRETRQARTGEEFSAAEISPYTESHKVRVLAVMEVMLRATMAERAERTGGGPWSRGHCVDGLDRDSRVLTTGCLWAEES